MNSELNYFLDQLIKPSEADLFTLPDVLLAMMVSALLSYVLSLVYRYTHRGTSYSQSFLLTMFIMAVATSVVMMIIGSNIARAFSLVGALSVIRFRTPVKDARDLAYLFAAIIAGMGCGTGFYMASIAMTAFISIMVIVLYVANFGLKQKLESILRVTYKAGEGNTLEAIERHMREAFADIRLINRIVDIHPEEETNVYVVRPGNTVGENDIERRLREIEGVVNLSIYQSDQHAPF